jgi:hypothetical protein
VIRSGDKIMVVAVSPERVLRAGNPKILWEGHYKHGLNSMCGPPGPSSVNDDVSADGQRFLMIQEADQDAPATQIYVVLNWSEELKRLTQSKND